MATTKGERQALLFLAAVALLGAAAKAWHSGDVAVPDRELDRQIGAVESLPTRHQTRDRPAAAHKRRRAVLIDSTAAGNLVAPPAPAFTPKLDLDTATASQIERLPGVSLALARRVVAARETKGAFGCLAAFDAVKGVGPAMIRRLDSLVTFSGPPQPICAQR